MSLLGIDVGTSRCKAAVFSEEGDLLSFAYEEYHIASPKPGWAELDTHEIWEKTKRVIQQVVSDPAVAHDPVKALAVTSLGEALVPVTEDRRILGPSILNFDSRGKEYLAALGEALPAERWYAINGNVLGNHYSLPKLLWIRDNLPDMYRETHKFLLWGSFVAFMLGADPVVDYSLANRTLLFDLGAEDWSEEILGLAGIDRAKLPGLARSGEVIGTVPRYVAGELGLPTGTLIVAGAHDQCAAAVGCGAIEEGTSAYGMGTFICITPVFRERRDPRVMIERGLCTEHHAVPGRFVTFIYNQAGSLVRWFRDTFAGAEHREAAAEGRDIYPALFAEMPEGPSGLIVIPHFTSTGPPSFISDSCGVIAGLRLETPRGAILKGILEGITFYLQECLETLPPTGIGIAEFRAVGGGSRSDPWVQLSADILGRPFLRPEITEAGVLGAAIIAGVGAGIFSSFAEGVEGMVRIERVFEPDPRWGERYRDRYREYKRLWPIFYEHLRTLYRRDPADGFPPPLRDRRPIP